MRRKKEVIIKMRLGAKASRVRTMIIFKVVTSWFGVFGALRLRFTVGILTSGAAKRHAQKSTKRKIFFKSESLVKSI